MIDQRLSERKKGRPSTEQREEEREKKGKEVTSSTIHSLQHGIVAQSERKEESSTGYRTKSRVQQNLEAREVQLQFIDYSIV